MKIKFTEAPRGRDYKVGDVVDFSGPIPEGYARKYIARGWAVEHVEPKKVEAPKLEEPKQPEPAKPQQQGFKARA